MERGEAERIVPRGNEYLVHVHREERGLSMLSRLTIQRQNRCLSMHGDGHNEEDTTTKEGQAVVAGKESHWKNTIEICMATTREVR